MKISQTDFFPESELQGLLEKGAVTGRACTGGWGPESEGQGGGDGAWGDGHSVTPTQVAIPDLHHPEIGLQALSGMAKEKGGD